MVVTQRSPRARVGARRTWWVTLSSAYRSVLWAVSRSLLTRGVEGVVVRRCRRDEPVMQTPWACSWAPYNGLIR